MHGRGDFMEKSGTDLERIIATDVSGPVATAKVADLYQGLRFTDYLSLLKTADGEWVIVNKAFHCESAE
jgi:hypothetical protein